MLRLYREALFVCLLLALFFAVGCKEVSQQSASATRAEKEPNLTNEQVREATSEKSARATPSEVESEAGIVADALEESPKPKKKKKGPITKEGELEQAYVALHHRLYPEAQRLFRMACKLGSVLGCVEAAHSAFHRRDVENKALAVADLMRSGGCTESLSSSCVLLGDLMRSSWMLKADDEAAKRYYGIACEAREPGSCVKLAQLFDGEDPKRAAELREKRVWREGKGANLPSLVRARNDFLEDACGTRNHHVSCLRLADFYAQSAPPWADHRKALSLYEKACGAKIWKACFAVGEILRYGKLEKDMQRAAQAYDKGCSGAHGSSCLQLARMFKKGDVEAKDPHRVESLLRMADQFQSHEDKEQGRAKREQTLSQAFLVLEEARAVWKPEGRYCVHRSWDYKFSGYSDRSETEVDGYRLVSGQRCRTRNGKEKCHQTMDPKYIGPMNGLFDRCEREVLSLEPDEYRHEVQADEQGRLLRCRAVPWECVGDCAVDLGIQKVLDGPCSG